MSAIQSACVAYAKYTGCAVTTEGMAAAIAAFLRNYELSLDERIFDTSDVTPQELKTLFYNIASELEGK